MPERSLREFFSHKITHRCDNLNDFVPPPPKKNMGKLLLPESCESLLGKLDTLERLVFPDLFLWDTAALRVGAPPGNRRAEIGFY